MKPIKLEAEWRRSFTMMLSKEEQEGATRERGKKRGKEGSLLEMPTLVSVGRKAAETCAQVDDM